MAKLVQQSTAGDPLFFFLTASSDHITGLTGATATVTISKNGAAFGAPAGAVSEIANGWYQVAGNATDTGTLGDIILHATATSADPFDGVVAQVVAFNPRNANLGLSNVSANVAQWNGSNVVAPNVAGVPLVDLKYTLGTISPAAAGSVSVDWAQTVGKTAVVDFTNTTIKNLDGNTVQTGDAFARLGAPAGASTAADIAAVKTDTAGIKTQTDKMAFTVANQIDANALSISGNATAAANVAHTNQALTRGTVGAASTTTSVITSAITSPASAGASGQFIGRVMLFDADTATANLQGQATNITANTTGATPTFTVTALTTAPASGDKFTIV